MKKWMSYKKGRLLNRKAILEKRYKQMLLSNYAFKMQTSIKTQMSAICKQRTKALFERRQNNDEEDTPPETQSTTSLCPFRTFAKGDKDGAFTVPYWEPKHPYTQDEMGE